MLLQFERDTIGPTLPVLNTEVSSFQRYFCIGLYQLGHYKMSSLWRCPHYRGYIALPNTWYVFLNKRFISVTLNSIKNSTIDRSVLNVLKIFITKLIIIKYIT